MTGLDTGVRDSTIRIGMESGKALEFHGPADITQETTDAIVNAANSSLLGGGGVDGAIHRAGGSAILAECRQIVSKIGRLPAGNVVITTGGRLAAKCVIHTVGPIYRDGNHGEAELLASCYRECYKIAREKVLKTLAFPAISCGLYSYPIPDATTIAVRETLAALNANPEIEKVIFACFGEEVFGAYVRELGLK